MKLVIMRFLLKGLSVLSLSSMMILSCTNDSKTNSTNKRVFQSIKLDDLHNHASAIQGEQKLNYTIHPDSVLLIDATDYNFIIPEQLKDKKIELVQVIIDKNVYQVDWSADNKTLISKNNLKLISGNTEFTGFENSKMIVIGIGVKQEPTEQGAIAMGIIYAAMIEVK